MEEEELFSFFRTSHVLALLKEKDSYLPLVYRRNLGEDHLVVAAVFDSKLERVVESKAWKAREIPRNLENRFDGKTYFVLPKEDLLKTVFPFDKRAARRMASEMGKNATERDIATVREKLSGMNTGPIAKIWDKVQELWGYFNDPNTPLLLKMSIIGALIYLVSPIDLIPDTVPFAGLLDDVAVILAIYKQFRKFLDDGEK